MVEHQNSDIFCSVELLNISSGVGEVVGKIAVEQVIEGNISNRIVEGGVGEIASGVADGAVSRDVVTGSCISGIGSIVLDLRHQISQRNDYSALIVPDEVVGTGGQLIDGLIGEEIGVVFVKSLLGNHVVEIF